MTLSVINSQIPEYYPTMYLDGYTPQQIVMAKRRQMLQSQTVDEIKVTAIGSKSVLNGGIENV